MTDQDPADWDPADWDPRDPSVLSDQRRRRTDDGIPVRQEASLEYRAGQHVDMTLLGPPETPPKETPAAPPSRAHHVRT